MSSQPCNVFPLEDARRRLGQNRAHTVYLNEGIAPPAPGFREAFVRHYDRIRSECRVSVRAGSGPGVVIIVVDGTGVVCARRLAARREGISAAIVGRHPATDIWVGGDPAVALRHLAIVVHPTDGEAEPRFRVLDLRTGSAMTDELGRRLESLEAEGAVFVTVGSCALFVLPTTPDDLPWPDDAEQAWVCIPERVYFDDAPARPDRWAHRPLARSSAPAIFGDRSVTVVQTFVGPARAQRRPLSDSQLDDGEQPVGALRLESDTDAETIEQGERALGQGVLLGRYDRCDDCGLPALRSRRVSRVHLLVLQVGGDVYAIDTASTNGVADLAGGEKAGRVFAMGGKRPLGLPGGVQLTWQPGS